MKYSLIKIKGTFCSRVITINNITIVQRPFSLTGKEHFKQCDIERREINKHKLNKVFDTPEAKLMAWQKVLILCIDDMCMCFRDIRYIIQGMVSDINVVYGRTSDLSDYAGVEKQANDLFKSQYRMF